MRTQSPRTWRWAALVGLCLSVIAIGCGDIGSPVSPSGFERGGARATAVETSSDYPVDTALPVAPGPATPLHGPGGPLTPADLIAHGWSCFTPPPFPTRTECSHPNQGFPPIPPPADRPATFTLWRFENGQFVGTLLAIRPDLYCGADVTDPAGTCTRNAPLCGSTGQPYSFVAVIGYYTCLHRPGR
jgi:hypothetical protein